MTRVMAQGTFDLLHPGHLHYLQESAALGDELVVVIARDSRVQRKKDVVMDEASRRDVIAALAVVDDAVLGSEGSIFDSVDRIAPDIITIGYDQPYDPAELETRLAAHGWTDIDVQRMPSYDGHISSSSDLRERLQRTAD